MNWLRPVDSPRAAVLLGAFDPPTNAHVAILTAAARRLRAPGVLCLTTVLLARPDDVLLGVQDRLRVLEALADEEAFGLCTADRGTYLEVGAEMRAAGIDATFVIGSDKLPQLADPSFYEDGEDGVAATFRDVTFLVVDRGGEASADWIGIDEAFENERYAAISATEVRRRLRAGEPVNDLVPPVVAKALERYTANG